MKDVVQKQKLRKPKTGRKKKGAEIFLERRNNSVQQTRDRKKEARKRLRMVQVQRNLDKQLDHLKAFPVNQTPVVKRPKGPLRQEEWKLRGAARPAALLARIAAGECDADGNEFKAPEPTKDFYEEMRGRFAEHKDTMEYLRLRKDLALATCAAGMMDAGIAHFEECMELDPTDAICAREGLVCALLDEGRADEARGIIDRYENVASPVLDYCRTIIEYVSWEVLEEDGSSEEIVQAAFAKAWAGNPFIAMFIAGYDAFNAVVEYVEDIKAPKRGSIEESFVYCAHNIGVWLDTVGARAWIQKEIADRNEPVATESDCTDQMYLGMYTTAVEMFKEEMAAGEEGDEGMDDDDE
ncbi:Aste57867_8832 [Aphanomyces stellatus]|uniref:Aste57867_8832 protein n=1 Tax=Aphanomyces stellatus TaxID=120398 RepID=A0A485KLP2_9STRA|nr:hypothetical protein As57867_008797 [Aphanomyces stellatus]VFT85718.1 Aste57867_8832 [Aphanomyces stellatus]